MSKTQPTITNLDKKLARDGYLSLLLTVPAALLLPFPLWLSAALVTIIPFFVWLRVIKSPFAASATGEAAYLQILISALLFGASAIDDHALKQFARIGIFIAQTSMIALGIITTYLGKRFHFPFNGLASFFEKISHSLKDKRLKSKFTSSVEYDSYLSAVNVLTSSRAEIESLSKNTALLTFKTELNQLNKCFEKISILLEKSPKSANEIRQYINYFPESVLTVLKKYIDLNEASQDERAESIRTLLHEVVSTSQEIAAEIVADKVMALDTQVQVIKKNIELGGF